jgi:hypothetical protein
LSRPEGLLPRAREIILAIEDPAGTAKIITDS